MKFGACTYQLHVTESKKILSGELRKIHFHGGVPRMNADSGPEVRLGAFPFKFTVATVLDICNYLLKYWQVLDASSLSHLWSFSPVAES
jgi:hypothetical protein